MTYPPVYAAYCLIQFYRIIVGMVVTKRILSVPVKILAIKKRHGPFYTRLVKHSELKK